MIRNAGPVVRPASRFLNADFLLRVALFATLAVYLQTITFSFVYDDFGAIVLNPWLSSWHGLAQIFQHDVSAYSDMPIPARHYRPVFLVWLWIVQHVFAPTPGWYHLCSIFTHLVAVALAYKLAVTLLKNELQAAVAVVLFAMHPTKVEAVTWISAASDPLMAVFFFLTVLTYIRFRESTHRRAWWIVASFLCAVAALLTKETAVVLPGIILAYEWLFQKPAEGKRRVLQLAAFVFPYVLADGLWFYARFLVLHGAGDGAIPASVKTTLLTAPAAFWLYVRQLVRPFHLSPLYPYATVNQFSVLHTAFPVAALLVLAAFYFVWSRKNAVLKFAAVWFLLTIAPVTFGFTWIQLHDRHLYLPSFAAALMAATAIGQLKWPTSPNRERIQIAAVLCIALAMSAISAKEARVWDSELTLFTRAVNVSPDNIEAVTLLSEAQANNGQRQLAMETLQHSLESHPNSERLVFTLGNSYYQMEDFPRARPLLERVARSATSVDYRSRALYDLSMIELKQNHYDAAEALLKAAVQVAPSVTGYQRLLGDLQRNQLAQTRSAVK
jgi:protein O-mannosyl-transferase